jgi:hypothetical protein
MAAIQLRMELCQNIRPNSIEALQIAQQMQHQTRKLNDFLHFVQDILLLLGCCRWFCRPIVVGSIAGSSGLLSMRAAFFAWGTDDASRFLAITNEC